MPDAHRLPADNGAPVEVDDNHPNEDAEGHVDEETDNAIDHQANEGSDQYTYCHADCDANGDTNK